MTWLSGAAVLACAFLFGGSLLFSSSVAAFLFAHLTADEAGRLLRRAFPWFYTWTIALAGISALLSAPVDTAVAFALGAVAASAVPARQGLMPAINRATDQGRRRRFQVLHGISVSLTLVHLVVYAWVLLRLSL